MKKRDTLNNSYSCRTNDNTIMESFQEIFDFLIEYFKKQVKIHLTMELCYRYVIL